MIKTGGTPYLRHAAAPNRRVQGGDKHHLYCKPCEDIISVFEKKFKSRVFDIATSGEKLPSKYGPWLSKFSASLSLRNLHSLKFRKISNDFPPSAAHFLCNATEALKRYVKGEQPSLGNFKQYIFYPGYFNSMDAPGLPQNWNSYYKRAVERDLIFLEDNSFISTFTKIGPLFFVGVVKDETRLLGNDFIRGNEGLFKRSPFDPPSVIWSHLKDRAKASLEIFDELSEKQHKKSELEVLKHADKFSTSEAAKVILEDIEQFGRKN
ncbi:hypothetical protein L0664_12860 [Octadecabacter sp. G9-8]|uniref:Uncharacterized protein n=1 Tax=Octadecabacter dasysiphoniae TaxID=2909341 RepID=A0ABS9CXK6_9RHOB|nr:hypothetical protein [Octadecabacter dasysiphoniae]MCF2871962.1 hypothetical protein [Octadecabacter dasysiphoniae]